MKKIQKIMFEISREVIIVNFGKSKKFKITRKDINNILPKDVYNRLEGDMYRVTDFFEMVISDETKAFLFLSKHFYCNGKCIKETVKDIKKKLQETFHLIESAKK
ncbi:MAG: hypothetical protein AABW67_03880 [Nanoarchaeota archaeon]